MGGAFSQLAVFEVPGQVQGLTRKRLRRYPLVGIGSTLHKQPKLIQQMLLFWVIQTYDYFVMANYQYRVTMRDPQALKSCSIGA